MAHGALGNDVLSPRRVFRVAIQAGYRSLVLAAVAGYCCRGILMTLDAVCHFERNPLRFRLMGKNSQAENSEDCHT